MGYWDFDGVRTKDEVEYQKCGDEDDICGFPTAVGRNTDYSYGFPMIQQTRYNGKKICGLLEMG
jgi:hypothetical protein